MPVEPLIAAVVFAGIFLGGGALHARFRFWPFVVGAVSYAAILALGR